MIILSALLIGLLSVPLPSFNAFADESARPFDATTSLDRFRSASPHDRYLMMNTILAEARAATDPVRLDGYLTFGRKTLELMLKENEEAFGTNEQWRLNSVHHLISVCKVSLAMHSPLNTDILMSHFRDLRYEEERQSVLAHWIGRIESLEERDEILELARYLSDARAVCEEKEDHDFVVDPVKLAEEAVIHRLMKVDPIYEGSYPITRCTGCEDFNVTSIILINTLDSNRGITAFLYDSSSEKVLVTFENLLPSQGGQVLEGASVRNHTRGSGLSTLSLSYDFENGNLRGEYWAPGRSVAFEARKKAGADYPSQFFTRLEHDWTSDALKRVIFSRPFYGTYGPLAVELSLGLKEIDGRQFIGGSLRFERSNDKITFERGIFLATHGVVALAGNHDGKEIKITLRFRVDTENTRVVAKGVSLNTSSDATDHLPLRFSTSRSDR